MPVRGQSIRAAYFILPKTKFFRARHDVIENHLLRPI